MEINNDTVESVKYIFGIIGSAILSFIAYIFKKRATRLTRIETTIESLNNNSNIVDIKIKDLKEDINEIKTDLKKILFKL